MIFRMYYRNFSTIIKSYEEAERILRDYFSINVHDEIFIEEEEEEEN